MAWGGRVAHHYAQFGLAWAVAVRQAVVLQLPRFAEVILRLPLLKAKQPFMDPASLGVLGTALSAFVAALSYWAKTRHERRRATRAVLYYLLELHHLVNRIHVSLKAFPSEYVAQCRRALAAAGKVLSEDDSESLTQGVTLALNAFTANELQGKRTAIPPLKGLV